MTPAVGHVILVIGNSLAASIIVKATIVISIAVIAAYFARHSRASVRHAILAAGFAVLLALPIAAIVAPPIHIALPTTQESSALATNSMQSFDETSLAPQTTASTPSSAAKSETASISLFDLLFVAWAIGAAIFLAPVIIGLWQIRLLRRIALPWSHGNSVATTLASELKISRRIEMLLHEGVAGPMTCGVFHPVIMFPVEAENWDDADLSRAIAHELEHVRRADWLTHCVARIISAAYWFHPVVWIAWRQLTLEAERVCDDAVLTRSEATAYAEQLVALARQLTAHHKSPLLAMASRSDLTARIHAILDDQRPRSSARIGALVLISVICLFAVAVSPLQLVVAAQAEQRVTRPTRYEVTSVKRDPNGDPNRNITWRETPDSLTLENVTIELLIRQAYGLRSYQIEHAPEWANQEEFDLSAKIGEVDVRYLLTLTKEQAAAERQLMLQSLLADRFRLAAHRETKEGSAYSLIVAKNGPKFHESPLAGANGYSVAPARPVVMGNGLLKFNGAPMSTLARLISQVIGRPVVDRTGLGGKYEFTLKWTPDEFDLPAVAQQPENTSSEPAGTSIFTVIQDQLGLKLESTKGMVETLVIDHVEQPSPN